MGFVRAHQGTTPKKVEGKLSAVVRDLGIDYQALFANTYGSKFIGILYDNGKLERVVYGLLNARKGAGAHPGFSLFVRQPLLAVFRFRRSGQLLVVITYHLTWQERSRRPEALWLYATVKALNIPEDILVILNGDSNVPQVDKQWEYGFTNKSQEVEANVYEHLLGSTDWTMRVTKKAHDTVLMRPAQQVAYEAKSRVLEGFENLSDHNPVLTTLSNLDQHDVNRDAPDSTTTEDFLVRLGQLKGTTGNSFDIERVELPA